MLENVRYSIVVHYKSGRQIELETYDGWDIESALSEANEQLQYDDVKSVDIVREASIITRQVVKTIALVG